MEPKSPKPGSIPCQGYQQQSKFSIHEHNLQEQLKKYSLQSIEQLLDIMIDPQLSALFKSKFEQSLDAQRQDSEMTDNQKHLMKLSAEHTYQEVHTYYELFPNLIQECRSVLQQKYLTDDILRSHHHRKSIWLLCSGALAQLKQRPHFNQTLTQYRSSTYPEFYRHTIEKDVVRTIQDKSQAQSTLSSILRNFAIKNPFIGYCQGMNFIVNFLLIMQFTEEQAFWLTTQLIQQLLPKTYYSNMLGVAIDITIIEHYIKLHHPLLSQKLAQMNLSLSLFTLEWLVCLFTSTLPFYMLVIVWDMLIIYGSQILVQVSIVILSELEDTILQTDDIYQLSCLGLFSKRKREFSSKKISSYKKYYKSTSIRHC